MNFADIVCGLAWGDEAKGKITSQMSKSGFYDFVVDGQVEITLVILFM